jgi:histidinol-phosphate phosphatase family protein
MKPALFLDRDGTIIEDRGYMRDPALVELLPGAADVLWELARAGWILVVVSNQSGVGRGLIALAEMEAVQTRFLDVMRDAGVEIAATYFCVHRPDENCHCRKPSTFQVEQAAREHGLDLSKSWMIGDRRSDIQCGKNAGCRTIWLSNPLFPVVEGLADFVAQDWQQVRRILIRG